VYSDVLQDIGDGWTTPVEADLLDWFPDAFATVTVDTPGADDIAIMEISVPNDAVVAAGRSGSTLRVESATGGYGGTIAHLDRARSGATTAISADYTGAGPSVFAFGLVHASGTPAPGEPTITAAGSAEDAVRAILASFPADTDDVEIYGSTTTGVDETGTLVGTLTASGSVFWTGRAPATTYYLRPLAIGEGGETWGDEVTGATFDDDFIDKGVDDAVLVETLSLLADETATHVELALGEMIRATSGLGRTRSVSVVVTDGDDETIGSDTFTGSDIANDADGETHTIPLSPNPSGPQTITVTATVTIAP
jgi:hypothetical protein